MASSRPRYSRLGRELDRQGLLKEEANELEGLGIPVLNLGTIVPWKGVALALFLLGLGSLLLTVGLMIHLGDIKVKDASRGWALIVLGLLTFLPGFYETRIAYYTMRRFPGYSFSHIPTM